MAAQLAADSNADQAPSARRFEIFFFVGLAVLAALMFYRASFGMEWLGDDAYTLSTATRYVQGDRPIVDSWETHFSSDMMAAPIVWALDRVSPDGTGLVLHYRYVFVVLQIIFAFVVWRLLRGLLPPPAAMLTSWIVFAYLPYYYVLLNYNWTRTATFTIAALLLLRLCGREKPSPWPAVTAGVLYAIGTFAYPTMIVAVPFVVAGVWWARCNRAGKVIGWFLGGFFAFLAASVVVTIAWAGTAHLAQVLPLFTHPGDRDMSLVAIFARFNRTRAVLGAPLVGSIVFAALALTLRSRPQRDAIALTGAILASVLTALVTPSLPHPLLFYMDIPQAIMFGIGTAFLLLVIISKDRYYRRLFWLLYLPTIGMAIGASFASLEGFETATMPAIITAIAAFLALNHAVEKAKTVGASARVNWLVPVALVTVLVALVVSDGWYYGGDSPVTQLTARLDQGAYAGIATTPANAALYAHYTKVFEPVRAAGGRTAFLEAFPTGYLMTGVRPGAYSVWSNFASGNRWQEYLDITGNYPTTIVSTRIPGPNGGLVAKPFAPPLGLRDFASKYYEIYRDADFVIYKRRTP